MLHMVHYNQVLVYLVHPIINSRFPFAQPSVFTRCILKLPSFNEIRPRTNNDV